MAILFAVVMVCSTALPAAISASAVDTSSLAGTTINVYNWGEYISDGSEGSMDVNAEFTKRTGIKVNYNNYDTNENMYAKLKSDGVSSISLSRRIYDRAPDCRGDAAKD